MKIQDEKQKARAFVGILYPESAPTDWLERAKETHLDMVISPLHDKDTNPDDTKKKAHHHIMVLWDGPTTFKNAQKILTNIGCINHIEMVESVPGQARYMIHLDNPEKYQYNREDVITLGAVSYEELCEKVQDKRRNIKQMTEYIIKNNITSFATFAFHCMENENEWFNILTDKNTLFIKSLIDSMYQDNKREMEKIPEVYVNVETGEKFTSLEEFKKSLEKGDDE